MYTFPADGYCYWERIFHWALVTEADKVMMLMALWKKMLLKSNQFRFSPGEFYFRTCALQICDNAKDFTSRSIRRFFFFYSSILKCCFRWQSYWCEFGHHKEILFTWERANRRFDFWCWLSCCEVPSTQTQDNFVSDVFFRIIVSLALFWLCKTWLLPRFVKYVIEIYVATVALGVLHLNFRLCQVESE